MMTDPALKTHSRPDRREAPLALNSLGFEAAPAECRVVVAMSGGVDSSVTAAVLKEQGYDVVGITLQLYDHGAALQKKGACCAGQDIHDAARVAQALDIPHYVLDYESRFRQSVMEEFADAYLAGQTPIPCVLCNQTVKFEGLLGMARDLGAACMATGHYVRRIAGPHGPELHRAVDETRDQSYFLFATTDDQLSFLRFPLGGLAKSQTREMATRLGLSIADKPDSQDICFVPQGHYASVIERLRPGAKEPGPIVHVDGRVLGRHDGIIHYTVGQRRGLGVASRDPLFVVALQAEECKVIVGPRQALQTRRLQLRDVNWIGEGQFDDQAASERTLHVKVRSTHTPALARLLARPKGVEVEFATPEEGVAPGQACVFYDGPGQTRVLGGGWIAGTTGAMNG